ncbi:hypothetical protein PSG01_16440 [Proteus mirabilis]|nr:hypothetical protein [Proteus mirabilis]
MNENLPPIMNEGALFSPQQFQQQAQWDAFTNQGVSGLSSPFTWGEWKKFNLMNHFYRQVACKFTNYGRGCQVNYAISIITNLSDINFLEI